MTKEEFKEKVKIKKWEIKNWLGDKAWKAKLFWDKNRDYLVVIIPAAVGLGGKAINSANRRHRIREEEYLKKQFMYDRRMGAYLELRRQPSQKELLQIDKMKKEGMSLPDILNKMRLLK